MLRWLKPPSRAMAMEDLRREYRYLGFAPAVLPEAVERDRYEFHFQFYRLLTSFALALAVFLVGAVLLELLAPTLMCQGWTAELWPWNRVLLANLTPSEVTDDLRSSICPIVTVDSWATCVWAPWLLFSLISEARRRDHYLLGSSRATMPLVVSALVVALGWWLCASPLATEFLALSANFREPAYVGAIKKGVLISIVSAGTAVWLLFANSVFLHRRVNSTKTSI
jgi:hypothetical protein